MKGGLFVGLATLDLIYQVEAPPQANQKIVALDAAIAAGGPAANAAVTFCHLGHPTTLAGAIGCHPLGSLIRADLEQWGVTIADLSPDQTEPPPTSSILVSQATGDRAVVSLNATRQQAPGDRSPVELLAKAAIVLIDGHQLAVGEAIARQAKASQVPVVVDGGSWKPGFEQILPWADYAICSANFQPPGCQTTAAVLDYLTSLGIPHVAITRGKQPIAFVSMGDRGEIPVPKITPVDTLAAGDIFHGAFCHHILNDSFQAALAQAAGVAARSCEFFGSRRWMTG